MIEKLIKCVVVLLCLLVLFGCEEEKKGEIKIDCNLDSNNPNCFKQSIKDLVPYETGYEYENYGDGEVIEYHWKETLAWFLESKDKHKYGYDRDPYSNFDYEEAALRGRDVYMSVEKGKNAFVKIKIDPETKKEYHLHKIDKDGVIEKKDVVLAKNICLKKDCVDDVSLPAGDYAVYYGDKDQQRYLHIIPYVLDNSKEVYYIQFGKSDAEGCFNDKSEIGCYEMDVVEEKFNEIMSQAVVNAKFESLSAKDVDLEYNENGFSGKLWIDLTEKRRKRIEIFDDDGEMSYKDIEYPIVNDLYEKIKYSNKMGCGVEYAEKVEAAKLYDPIKDIYYGAYDDYNDKVDEYNDALFKECTYEGGKYVNCSSRIATLKKEVEELKKLCDEMESNYGTIIVDYNEKSKAFSDAYQKARKKHIALGINEMRIGWKVEGFANEVYENLNAVLNLCQKEEYNGPIGIGRDDIICNKKTNSLSMRLYNGCTKNDYSVQMKISAYNRDDDSFFASISGAGSFDRKCQYFVYADVFPFVPDDAQTAQVTISELKSKKDKAVIGGLVWGAHLNGGASLNTIVHEIGHSYGLTDLYIADDEPTYASTYAAAYNTFAFDEGNIMFWQIPSGQRIRYRPLFVVKTGSNDRCILGKDSEGHVVYGVENQWDCIRSNSSCFVETCEIK